MKNFSWIVCLLVVAVLASPAHALLVRRGQSVEVSIGEVIEDDLIVFASSVEIKGVVTGNVCAFAQTVNVSGDIGGSLFIGAASSNINASSVQTIWAAGGNLNVSGKVDKNVILAGGSLNVDADAGIGKDLHAYGGNFAVNGEIDGAIKGAVGRFVMAGKSSRVKIRADEARVKSTAVISGDFILTSESQPKIDEGAVITGETTIREIEPEESRQFFFAIAPLFALLFGVIKVIIWVSKIIVGILLIALCRNYVRRVMDTLIKVPWKSLGLGFLGVIVIPVVAVVLFATLIGYPLGLVAVYAYTILLYVSSLFVAVVVGEKVIQLFRKGKEVSLYLSFITGMLILLVVSFIPILNFLVRILVILFGFGSVMLGTWQVLKEMRGKDLI
ncbi:MAG: hypothetical protein JSV53_07565 [candidate division WOR-3 bacterium]|nr:MAG: hypothetical protein JSV53_07565 [candidate division WOR-3 bacterium]